MNAPATRHGGGESLTCEIMPNPPKYALQAIFGPGLENMLHHTPHANRLRMQVISTAAGVAVVTLPFAPELVGDPGRGVVFGGVITTLLDQASGLAVACSMEDLKPIATVDLRVDYLRAAHPGSDLFARTECYKLTRNVAFVRGIAWDHDEAEPFATSLGTFMIGSSPVLSAGMARLAAAQKGKPS